VVVVVVVVVVLVVVVVVVVVVVALEKMDVLSRTMEILLRTLAST
jgi:hypothetical protein